MRCVGASVPGELAWLLHVAVAPAFVAIFGRVEGLAEYRKILKALPSGVGWFVFFGWHNREFF